MKFNILIALLLLSACDVVEEEKAAEIENWQLLPFVKVDAANPVLESEAAASFFCLLWKNCSILKASDSYTTARPTQNSDGREGLEGLRC